ncbi:DNA-binding protein Fis [compost metagenome]
MPATPSLRKNPQDRLHEQPYFRDLDGESPNGMYDMLLRLVEKPLLEVVMNQADNNQSRAAEWLGLNRNTLRKKLVEHQML